MDIKKVFEDNHRYAKQSSLMYISKITQSDFGPPGVLGIWGEWLFSFRELGSTGNFQGFGELAHSLGVLVTYWERADLLAIVCDV